MVLLAGSYYRGGKKSMLGDRYGLRHGGAGVLKEDDVLMGFCLVQLDDS